MSGIKVCKICGCTELISDRSLGGKMICARCGSSIFVNKTPLPLSNRKIIYLFIFFLILLLVII